MRATAPLLKDMNERTVLEAIRSGAPISRAEISRRAGVSKPTVSLALQSLLDAGLVRGAICDLHGAVRARQDLERSDAGADAALTQIAGLHAALVEAAGLPGAR